MIIYKATNINNNRSYIGQTSFDLNFRIKSHLSEAKRNNLPFHNALLKHKDNFIWEILEQCTSKEEMDEMEFHYIIQYNTLMPNGYNLTLGGEGNLGWTPTPNQKKNISNGVKRWWNQQDDIFREKWGLRVRKQNLGQTAWNKGVSKEIDERVMKISTSNIGKKHTEEHKIKIGNSIRGRKLSDETKNKIRKTKYKERNGWHLSNIKKEQLESKSKFIYKILSENGSLEIVKVLSVWCRENGIDYEKIRHYINKDKYKFGYKIERLK